MPHSFAFFADEWASANEDGARSLPLTKRHNRAAPDLQRPLLKFHTYWAGLSEKVRTKAAPFPLFRAFYTGLGENALVLR